MTEAPASLHLPPKKPTRKPGVKSEYRAEYASQAHKLCLLGVQDRDLAAFFGVCRKTILNWKTIYADFADAITRGKKSADMEVAASLYQATLDRVITTKQAIKCKEIYYDDKLRMAYNNDVLRFYSDSTDPALYADVTLTETTALVLVNTEPKVYFTIRLYPDPQGQFYINLQPYVAATLNTRNFEDTLQPALAAGSAASFTYGFSSGTLLIGNLKIAAAHAAAPQDTSTTTLVWLGGAQQFGDYSRISTSDLLLLSPAKKEQLNEYYFKYWQGYPFDVSILDYSGSFIARRNYSVVNLTNALTVTLLPRGNVTRLVFSDGRTDETLETLLPLAEGMNKLKISTTSTRQKWAYVEKMPYRCGVYLKWLNPMGGYSYWLFEDTYSIDRSSKYQGEIDRDNENIENAFGRTLQTGKESQDTLKIIAELLTEDERRIVETLLDSPKIYLFTGKPLSQNSYRSWVEVTLKTGSARLKNPKQPLTNFTFDIELPVRYAQSL